MHLFCIVNENWLGQGGRKWESREDHLGKGL